MAITPITRKENFLARAAGENGLELDPVTREEYYLNKIAEGGGGGGGSVTVDTALSPTSPNPVQNKAVYAAFANAADIIDGKEDKPIDETISEAAASITPEANAIYKCGTLTSLTVTDPPATGSYSIVFTSGSTATTTTIPASIIFPEAFSAEANTHYEINVEDGYALVASWPVS